MSTTTFPEPTHLLFYKNFQKHPVIQKFQALIDAITTKQNNNAYTNIYFDLKSRVLSISILGTENFCYADTPWKNLVLREIIADENPMNLLMEKTMISKEHPFFHCFCKEIEILSQIYHFNWVDFLKTFKIDNDYTLCSKTDAPPFPHNRLDTAFLQNDAVETLNDLNVYIQNYGLGIFEQSCCFKIESAAKKLVPISGRHYKKMEELIGYNLQKKAIIDNTAAFIKNYQGLNVLLQGDMGTGKSTMVKALLNTFSDTKLRMIEVKRSQLSLLPEIMGKIAGRPYPFIIFIDDLSFDENDEDFKLFKNSLEGSLEDNPKNIRIYATSNKRHLITETRSERDDAIHARDIMQEKLSLTARFGLVLNFTAPDQNDYLDIVFYLAASKGVKIADEELKIKALQWEKRHLNRSGRTAEQFIENLLTQVSPR